LLLASGAVGSLAQHPKVVGEVGGGGKGVGVVLAQDPAAALQGVLIQVTGGQSR
jgi:hypothetical protein